MKFFKSKPNFKLNGGACLDNASSVTSEPLNELIQTSDKMIKDGPLGRLFAPLNKRELTYIKHLKEGK